MQIIPRCKRQKNVLKILLIFGRLIGLLKEVSFLMVVSKEDQNHATFQSILRLRYDLKMYRSEISL